MSTTLKTLLQTTTAVVAVSTVALTSTAAFAASISNPDISAGITASTADGGGSVGAGNSITFNDAGRNEGGTGENSLDDTTGAPGIVLDVDDVTVSVATGVNLESLDATNDSAVISVTAGQGGTGTTIDVASGASITGVADGNAIDIAATGQATINVSGTVTTSGTGVAINAAGAPATGVVGGINITGGTVSSAGTAIDISGDSSASTITINDGTVTGNIVLGGTAADTINITGTDSSSTIAGTITGDSTVGFTLDVDADFAAGGNITDVTTIDVSGTKTFDLGNNQIDSTGVNLSIQGAGTTDLTGFAGEVATATSTTVASGATVLVDADSTIGGNLTVAGAVSGALVLTTDGAGDDIAVNNGASFNNSIAGGDDNTQDTITFALGDANDIALGASTTITNFANLNVVSGGVSATANLNVGAVSINGTPASTELNVAGNTSGSLTTDNGITITSGILTTGASTTIASDINLVSTNGHLNGAVQFDGSGRTLTVTGDGSGDGGVLDAITGGAGADNITVNLSAAGDTLATNGAINLAGGTDAIVVQQGTFNVGHDVTAESTTMGANGNSTVNLTAGTYTGNFAAAATANVNTVNVSGTTVVGNIDLSAGSGANVISYNAGSVSGTITGGSGADTLNVSNGTLTTQGNISAIETIAVNGGDLTVASGNTITGVDTNLSIAAGDTLTANGNVSGTGTFTWNGTLNVASGASLSLASLSAAPGASATYVVNLADASTGSQVVLSGGGADFTSNSATISVNTSAFIADGSSWTIVDGAGASSATAPTSTSALVSYSVSTADSGNDLVLTLNRTSYASVTGSTDAANSVGQALQDLGASASGDLATIQAQMDALTTTAAVNDALESLVGSTDAGVMDASISVQTGALNTVNDRLASLRSTGSGIATGDANGQRSVWIEAFGNSVDQDDRGNEKGFDATTYGLTVGADSDAIAAGYTLGVAASYGLGDIDSNSASNASTDVSSYQLTGYLSREKIGAQELFLNAMISAAYNEYESARQVAVGSFTNTASSDYSGWQYGARAEVGKDYFVEDLKAFVSPVASLQYSHLNLDSYTETGAGGANLTVNPEDVNAIDLGLGVNASWQVDYNDGSRLIPEARLSYKYRMGDTDLASTSTFAGGGNSFKTTGVDISRSGAEAGVGVTYQTQDGMEFSANYDADVRSDYFGHSAQLRFRYRF